jgi:CrcB protein
MRKFLFIAAGGSAGAVLRYVIGQSYASGDTNIPLDTLAVNTTGCFFLAFILAEAFEALGQYDDLRAGLSIGLLGAFTTFSTLCRETAGLISHGLYFPAALYAAVSVLFGIAAAYLGYFTAHKMAGNKL